MKKVVIVGGGFVGSRIAKKLEKRFEVILIDKKDYFEFTPGILRVITDTNHFKKITIKHSEYLKKSKIILGDVKKFDSSQVYLKENKIKFDYLVVCSGSSYTTPFKDQIVIASRSKTLLAQHKKLSLSKKIGIIGGGPVGVELAGEIIEKYPNKKIIIIDSKNKLMARMLPKSSEYVKNFLEKKNVEIFFNSRIDKVKNNTAYMGENKIHADIFFLTSGITPNNYLLNKSLNEYKINHFLQIEGFDNIFVGGDVAEIKEEKLAQNAQRQADVIIKNIISLDRGHHLTGYKSKKVPMVVNLGKYDGIIEYGRFSFGGFIPGIMKSFIEWKEMIYLRYL